MKYFLRLAALALAIGVAACMASTAPPPPVYGPAPSDPVATAPEPAPAPAPPVQPAPPPPPAPPPMPPAPPAPPTEPADHLSDRQFDRRSDWDKLGERWVEGGLDHDTIKVGKKDGKFVAIAVLVEHSQLEMFDILVTFGDGSTWSPPTRLIFGQDSTSRVIDLPGDARYIKKVEFKYGNLPGTGKAQVELWGLDARHDDRDRHDGPKKGHGRGHRH